MGNKISFPSDKKIVVLGAGYGGLALGNQLKSASANFLLVDQRDAMHHNMAAVRAVAQPGFAPQTLMPFKPHFGDKFKLGKVVDIKPPQNKLVLASGEEVTYDTLVIATGTTGPFPLKMMDQPSTEALKMYEDIAQKVKSSSKIVVIGGGAAGVELGAEIAAENPDKSVTIVHGHNELVSYPNVTKDFKDKLNKNLNDLKVNLVLGEKVTNMGDFKTPGGAGVVKTDKGNSIESDCVFTATGLRVFSEAYANSELGATMEKNGALKVNKHLQVEGYDNIYAMGDCNNVQENKVAMAAEAQAGVVAKNIAAQYNKSALVEYKAGSLSMAIVLALSKSIGMAQLAGGRILPDFLANKMKAADCMASSYWKKFGAKPPAN